MITAKDVWQFVSEHVNGGGACWDSPIVRQRVDEAHRLLAKRNPEALGSAETICICTSHTPGCETPYVSLPREFDAITGARPCGHRAFDIVNSTWGYMAQGPYTDNANTTGYLHIMDGQFPIQRDMDGKCSRLLAVSDAADEYPNSVILVQGIDAHGRDIFTGSQNQIHGERMLISGTQPFYTANTFSRITGVVKTKTKGFIRLYQYYEDSTTGIPDGSRRLLSTYHPDEGDENCSGGANQPGYVRYSVPEMCENITARVRRRVLPLVHGNDIPVVQDLDAFKAQIMALAARGAGDFQGMSISQNVADQEITRQQQRVEGEVISRVTVETVRSGRGIGRFHNRTYRSPRRVP